MSRRVLVLSFAAAFALAALLLLPLRFALGGLDLDRMGIGAGEAAGTVWHGRLRAARWRGQALGDVALRLQPLPLLGGVRRVHLAGDTLSLDLLQGRVRGLDAGNGELVLEGLDRLPGASLRIALQDAAMRFDRDGCRHADGAVRVELRVASLPAIALSGRLSCAGEVGRLALASDPAAVIALEAILEIERDGGYRLQSLARSDDPATRLALQLAGFQEGPAGMSRVDAGGTGD